MPSKDFHSLISVNFLALSFTIFFSFSLPHWLSSLRIEPMFPAVEVRSLNHWTQGSSSFASAVSPLQGCTALWDHAAFCLYYHALFLLGCSPHFLVEKILPVLVQMSPSSVNPSLTNTPCLQMDLTALYFLLRHFTIFLNGMNNTLFLQERKYSSLWVQRTKCDRNPSSWDFMQTTFF